MDDTDLNNNNKKRVKNAVPFLCNHHGLLAVTLRLSLLFFSFTSQTALQWFLLTAYCKELTWGRVVQVQQPELHGTERKGKEWEPTSNTWQRL